MIKCLLPYNLDHSLLPVDYLYHCRLITENMIRYISAIILLFWLSSYTAFSQPLPCGSTAVMTNNCADACVICDINGFTSRNDLSAGGQDIGGIFCSGADDMHFIAFIAGTPNLSIRIDVDNCNQGWCNEISLDLGFYESLDCQNFTRITPCRMDLRNNDSFIFDTTTPLVVGQHYYLIMDGSCGSICDWTFTVEEGSTQVTALEESGEIIMADVTCPNFATLISNAGQEGASIYNWTVNGNFTPTTEQAFTFNFTEEGTYEVCCTAANPCDEGPQICDSIVVRTVENLEVAEIICDGECVEYNNVQFCQTGFFEETVILPSGCDSLIFIDLEVLPQPINDVDVWICNDDFFFIGTESYNETGSYSGIVLTENDCDSIVNLELLVIECEIVGIPEEIPVICNGTATGTLIFSVDQGEPPLTWTYTNIEDTSITGTGMTNLLIDNPIPNIPAGIYQIYIQDDFGNDVVVLQEVTEPDVLEIELVPSEFGDFNLSCNSFYELGSEMMVPGNDGSLSANVIGGVEPYTYLWSDGQDSQTAENLEAITYMVTVTDDVGCSIESSFTLDAPPVLQADIDFRDPTCDGFNTGVIEVLNTSGGTPNYEYSLNNPNSFQEGILYTDLFEGNYELFIRDSLECISLFNEEIVAPDIPVITFSDNPEIKLCDSVRLEPSINDAALDIISWSGDDVSSLSCTDCLNPFASPTNNAEYILSLTSVDGCTTTDSISVFVEKRRRVYVANIFSPNGDGNNDIFLINAGCEASMVTRLGIYDRWGSLVYEVENILPNDENSGWNGVFNNEDILPGVYSWQAEILFIDGMELPFSDHFTLIR